MNVVAQLEVLAPPAARPLALRSVVKRWRGSGAPVLDGVDLDVDPGSVVAVTGRNGCGKTTLLRIAAGIIHADAGQVTVAGSDRAGGRRDVQRRIGYVSAGNGALYARLTVEHHLALWARLALIERAGRCAAIDRMLDRFALAELRGRRVQRLSTGQRQRLRLALGFLHDPCLVLLDEPEGSLDDEALELLAGAIDDVRSRGGAVLMCSPSGFNGTLVHDRMLTLAAGRLEER